MTLYLDTSLLVAALVPEEATTRVQEWLAAQDQADLAISHWVLTEFSAALSVKLRTGALLPDRRAAALAALDVLTERDLIVLPIDVRQFRGASRFADQYALGVRAGDALHLAICADHGATLCTLDRRLAEAGPALGIPTTIP